jgi:deazaflavin-dependent oxidoreductase (nitroreductase family)
MSDRMDMNRPVIDEFRSAGGRVGGYLEGMDLLLLHHTGAKSGTPYVSPLATIEHPTAPGWAVTASNGGRDTHPAWYFNIQADPHTTIELPDGKGGVTTLPVHARVAEGAERDALFTAVKKAMPQFAGYESATSRVIPLVVLEPVD